ncbi:BnaA10g10610D [Brassica napus]|uniref:BnaA10g10610D protein n=1 Tax=Brassica napus TaxID=3708 RepID=A0A078H7F5_BRANA|nr:BnaA10g10610D [Brassica napus]
MLMRTPPSIIGLLKSWPGSAFSLIGRLGGVGCLTITKWGLLIGLLCLKSLLYLYQVYDCELICLLFQNVAVAINSGILSVLHMATLPKAFMKAILESFTRVLQGLAFNIVA